MTITTPNAPPIKPRIPSGPSEGQIETPYKFQTSATDPNDNQIKYIFDWGDGTSTTTEFIDSGLEASAIHSWINPGTYSIKVKAKNSRNLESLWSPTTQLEITDVGAGAGGIRILQPTSIEDTPKSEGQDIHKNDELLKLMSVILIMSGLLFTALTTIKKDISIELGFSEKSLKYVGSAGILLIIIGSYILLKCSGLK